MAYRFQSTQPIPDEVRRIAGEEIDSAIDKLASGKNLEEAVHDARKRIKKTRGLVRLMQAELGEVYRSENVRFRNIGRRLSKLRDAAAILETFDDLVRNYAHSIPKADLAGIRRGLEAGKHAIEKSVGVPRVVRGVVVSLKTARKRVAAWPLRKGNFEAISPGLEKAYRRGQKAMAVAGRDSAAAKLHDWRKRVKDQRYHITLLTGLAPEEMQVREKNLHELESWLGEHHNLAVLSEQIEAQPDRFGGEIPVGEFLHLAKGAGETLREKAFALGEKLYREKPKKFIGRLEGLCRDWQQTSARKPAASATAPKAKKKAA